MRVLQLIDSLATGGAERVAVNLTNSLNEQGVETWLCATRQEGPLKDAIEDASKYLFLNKTKTLDRKAAWRLAQFILQYNIQIIHAHSSSYFLAIWVRQLTSTRVIWHDHYGNRERTNRINTIALIISSFFFNGVLCVNTTLKHWAEKHLRIHNDSISVLPNFSRLNKKDSLLSNNIEDFSTGVIIICLANLRYPKDHLILLQSISIIKDKVNDFRVWLIGNDYGDAYSEKIKDFIRKNNLEEKVLLLGARSDVAELLGKAHIGVLSSESEGFPVALMEYGQAGLPVVCTDVGQCREILDNGNCGILVSPKDTNALANGLGELIVNPERRIELGEAFRKRILKTYSSQAVIEQLVSVYKRVLNA